MSKALDQRETLHFFEDQIRTTGKTPSKLENFKGGEWGSLRRLGAGGGVKF